MTMLACSSDVELPRRKKDGWKRTKRCEYVPDSPRDGRQRTLVVERDAPDTVAEPAREKTQCDACGRIDADQTGNKPREAVAVNNECTEGNGEDGWQGGCAAAAAAAR